MHKKNMVIVFDFDGVIVDSNRLKINSFIEAIPETETALRELMQKLYDPGKTRTEMYATVFRELGKQESEIAPLVEQYATRYEQTVQSGIAKNGLNTEVITLLKKLAGEGYALYVNSDTPQEALVKSVKALGLTDFFKGIFGRPASKEANLQKIAQAENVKPLQILGIGDGASDLRASRSFGCQFLGLRNEFNHWTEREEFPTVGNLIELLDKI